MKRFTIGGAALALFALAACSYQFVLNNIYEESAQFQIEYNGESYVATCDLSRPGDPAQRAQQSVVYAETQIAQIATEFADEFIDPNSNVSTLELNRRIDAQAQAIVDHTDREYGCIAFPPREERL